MLSAVSALPVISDFVFGSCFMRRSFDQINPEHCSPQQRDIIRLASALFSCPVAAKLTMNLLEVAAWVRIGREVCPVHVPYKLKPSKDRRVREAYPELQHPVWVTPSGTFVIFSRRREFRMGGAFKVVLAGLDLSSPTSQVVCFSKEKKGKEGGMAGEIAMLTQLRGATNITSLHSSWNFGGRNYCVQPLFAMDLFDFVRQGHSSRLTRSQISAFFLEIARGVYAMHERGVAHCDLKPENILVDKSGDEVAITDFNLSSRATEDLERGKGSPHFAAPEAFRATVRDWRQADVFSLGVLLYVVVYSSFPLWVIKDPKTELSIHELARKMKRFSPEDLRPTLSRIQDPLLNKILHRMLDPNPMGRWNCFAVSTVLEAIVVCQRAKERTKSARLDAELAGDLYARHERIMTEKGEGVEASLAPVRASKQSAEESAGAAVVAEAEVVALTNDLCERIDQGAPREEMQGTLERILRSEKDFEERAVAEAMRMRDVFAAAEQAIAASSAEE